MIIIHNLEEEDGEKGDKKTVQHKAFASAQMKKLYLNNERQQQEKHSEQKADFFQKH